MRKDWAARTVEFATYGLMFLIVFLGVFGFLVMGLWNWLMPRLFGLPAVTYWQSVGLLILSKIFFGSFRGGHGRHRNWHWRRRMFERWEQMTPEERERFRETLRRRSGPFGASAEKPNT